VTGALERRLQAGRLEPPCTCVGDALPGPVQCLFVHGGKATLAVG